MPSEWLSKSNLTRCSQSWICELFVVTSLVYGWATAEQDEMRRWAIALPFLANFLEPEEHQYQPPATHSFGLLATQRPRFTLPASGAIISSAFAAEIRSEGLNLTRDCMTPRRGFKHLARTFLSNSCSRYDFEPLSGRTIRSWRCWSKLEGVLGVERGGRSHTCTGHFPFGLFT